MPQIYHNGRIYIYICTLTAHKRSGVLGTVLEGAQEHMAVSNEVRQG